MTTIICLKLLISKSMLSMSSNLDRIEVEVSMHPVLECRFKSVFSTELVVRPCTRLSPEGLFLFLARLHGS